jgi:hypothetical protein
MRYRIPPVRTGSCWLCTMETSRKLDGRYAGCVRRWDQEDRRPASHKVSRRFWFCSLILVFSALSPCTAWLPSLMKRPCACGTHRSDQISWQPYCCDCYHLPLSTSTLSCGTTSSESSGDDNGDVPSDSLKNIQWELFRKHHARFGCSQEYGQVTTSWVGRWTTYDYVGDILIETMPASVNYIYTSSPSIDAKVQVTHTISTGSATSDCATCFDDPNTSRTIPITLYTPESIGTKTRLGACSMVVGPSILQKSGTSKCIVACSLHSW